MDPHADEKIENDYIKVDPKQPPPYIDKYFIQQTLEVYFDCNVILNDCRFYCVTRRGETFSSEIYRVHVNFTVYNRGKEGMLYQPTTHQMSLLVKDVNLNFKRPEGSNEFIMHKYFLSRLKEKLVSIYPEEYAMSVLRDPKRVCKVAPNCLICFLGKYEVYVLEDLNSISFCLSNRFNGLNLIESQYVMKKLAHIHAASMVYLREHPKAEKVFLPSPLANGINPFSYLGVATCEGMGYAIRIAKHWPGYEHIVKRMRIALKNFNKRLINVMAHKKCTFKVMVHGEPWAKNIFIKYAQRGSNLSPRDATFVDFQMSFIGSCGYDINYFLQTSVDFYVLINYRHTLIDWYYKHLTRTLIKLNYPTKSIPTLAMVLNEIWQFEFIGYHALLVHLPITCMDEDTSTDFRLEYVLNIYERKAFFDMVYSYSRVHYMLHYGLQRFASLGVI